MMSKRWIFVALFGLCFMIVGSSAPLVGMVKTSSPMFQFDPLWNQIQEHRFSLEEDGTFSLKIEGSQVTFPATLDALSPIIIKTK